MVDRSSGLHVGALVARWAHLDTSNTKLDDTRSESRPGCKVKPTRFVVNVTTASPFTTRY